jgi:hypothetical protein
MTTNRLAADLTAAAEQLEATVNNAKNLLAAEAAAAEAAAAEAAEAPAEQLEPATTRSRP